MAKQNYGRMIAGLRTQHRLKQDEVAKESGVWTPTLVQIEGGAVTIDREMYLRLKAAIEKLAAEAETPTAA